MARRDTLRIYDQAVSEFFKLNLKVPGIDLTPRIVFATPERPFGFDLKTDTDRAVQTLETPVISITRLSLTYAMIRNNTVPWRNVRYWDENKQYAVSAPYPKPWDIPYQIDIHGRFREDCNEVLRWFLFAPNPVKSMVLNFQYPWETQSVSMIFNQIIDNSELETDERERWIRHTIPFVLEAFMFEAFDNDGDVAPTCGPGTSITATTRQRTVHFLGIQVCDLVDKTLYDSYRVDLTKTPNTVESWTP